ncbi:olfactory receptor 52Z1P-like [Engraulis encrasicolus]|uniref:olfactory receptor 52Z1P-like n=1 Tax=Engraulis encrasicolus TaxID=184585 RepID=UPI002FD69326
MKNISSESDLLVLQDLGLHHSLFFILAFVYIVILFLNIGVLLIITAERSLHQPMYLLFCNLSVNDIIGSTALFPHLLFDAVSKNRFISYNACVAQVFFGHTYGSASQTILIVMAIDRYVAICNPLRYSAIMTTKAVVTMSVSAWAIPVVCVGALVGLSVRLSRCRSLVPNFYCDNASLFKLSCEDVSVNNIYGLFYSAALLSSSMGTVVTTYTRIFITCWNKKSAELTSKALQTCSSHLVLYVTTLLCAYILVIMHRLPESQLLRQLFSFMYPVIPGHLNAIIYGLQTKQLRSKILQLFSGWRSSIARC